jgi:hypothetical protein
MGLAGPDINWSYMAPRRPNNRETTNKTRKITNKIFAIPAAAPAIPPKPNKAATRAITRKKIDQDNIFTSPFILYTQPGFERRFLAKCGEFDTINIDANAFQFNQGYSYIQVGNQANVLGKFPTCSRNSPILSYSQFATTFKRRSKQKFNRGVYE